MTNADRFWVAYEVRFRKAAQRSPLDYMCTEGEIPQVVARMRAAVERKGIGGVALSPTIRATARGLKIKPTYKGISAFLNEGVE